MTDLKTMLCRILFRSLPAALHAKTLTQLVEIANRAQGTNAHHIGSRRPFAEDGPRFRIEKADDRSTAIVLQGPLVLEQGYTLETVRRYCGLKDLQHVIVSTWESQDADVLEACRQAGAHVVVSPLPAHPGMWNLNFQVASTQAGLRAARSLGATHVIKSRADQRMSQPGFASLFHALADSFAPEAGDSCRIVACSANTFAFRPYSVSDMLLFADLATQERLWDIPENREQRAPGNFLGRSLREVLEQRYPEYEIWAHHFQRLGRPFRNTLEDYHELLARRFVIVNHDAVGLHWVKDWNADLDRSPETFGVGTARELMTFGKWLRLHRYWNAGYRAGCSLEKTVFDSTLVAEDGESRA